MKGSPWDGSKYLHSALESGYLGAANNDRLKFAVMWCNHDLGSIAKGAIRPETFESLTDDVIEKYFKHPSYWKIDGCPYFSIYQFKTFLETFGGDRKSALKMDPGRLPRWPVAGPRATAYSRLR